MAEVELESALASVSSAPPSHPDLQATVTDFSDYTEYFPSDLYRSLTLIEKLDNTYLDDAARVHDLTLTYSILPSLAEGEKPDRAALRKQISSTLDHALRCRFSAFAEASRLAAAAQRHKDRIISIRKKLQAQPQPPSRDPTPPPLPPQSPTSARRRLGMEKTPRITLHVDGSRYANTARPATSAREKQRRRASTGGISPRASDYESYDSDEEEEEEDFDTLMADGPIKVGKAGKVRMPKKGGVPRPPRVRAPGVMGTNVHSSIAGISTSNALAKLTPPPDDARIGSRHKPWHKLTEYEMALLRKTMKKNAIWTPSETMVRRELVKHGRGMENYLRARSRAEEDGEEFVDEEPHDPFKASLAPGEVRFQPLSEKEEQLKNRGMKLNEAKKEKRKKQAEEQAEILAQSRRGADGDEDESEAEGGMDAAVKRLQAVRASLKLDFRSPSSPATIKKDRSGKKRKRDGSPEAPNGGVPRDLTPMPKKLRITNLAATGKTSNANLEVNGTPTTASTDLLSPVPNETPSHAHLRKANATTTSVPLAPAGSSTPTSRLRSAMNTRQATPSGVPSDAKTSLPLHITTAALSRPRRGSLARASPLSPHPGAANAKSGSIPMSPTTAGPGSRRVSSRQASRASTPQRQTRPRSRGTTTAATGTSGKAQSAEPPLKRELRRGSNISLPADGGAAEGGARSASRRHGKKPAPGFVVQQEEGTGKIKISMGKRKGGLRGGRGGGKAAASAAAEEQVEDVDPNEPRYCVCGDVSYGTMICCSNDDCEKEWFHIACVGIEEDKMPGRRAKWYCTDCQAALKIDEKGVPLPPSTGSGRRGR